jgi:hypothetical protein
VRGEGNWTHVKSKTKRRMQQKNRKKQTKRTMLIHLETNSKQNIWTKKLKNKQTNKNTPKQINFSLKKSFT